MVFVALASYFSIISFLLIFAIFPGVRRRILGYVAGVFEAGSLRLSVGGAKVASGLSSAKRGARHFFSEGSGFARKSPLVVVWAILGLLAPTLFVFLIHKPAVFDYSDTGPGVDRQITVLLNGEQLVPPAPLPPEMFTTQEVEMVRPDVVHASRNWDLLQADFRQRLLVVFKLMQERHGYEMVLIEGYRSPQRQAQLFEKGAHVTQAGANMSYHQYGLAADSAFLRDGKVVISERDPWAMRGYELYGQVAEQVGLTWGGRWKMLDLGHVELRKAGVLGR
ncbi:MAG: M15 family metallopeptidase [Azonexaceae bacterium]|nr:M15 family metallopeptidase [Azonexaceae bacterium]